MKKIVERKGGRGWFGEGDFLVIKEKKPLKEFFLEGKKRLDRENERWRKKAKTPLHLRVSPKLTGRRKT